jgi:phosphoribosylglycinamide formyltransferase 1
VANLSRLVVLISGNGSNLQAILDACTSGALPATVVSAVSNKADAYGLVRARKAGVEAVYFPKQEHESRVEYDARLAAYVSSCQSDYIILAGWMRILSAAFLSCFPDRVINLHPALPGTFPGMHAIERAYAAYQRGDIKKTGVMVHFVPDEGVDNGPVLGLQEICFMPGEGLEQFEARVHDVEHKLLVDTLKDILQHNKRSA